MNKHLFASLAWAGGIILLALGAATADNARLISNDTATRVVMCAIGLCVAWYGNRMPKAIVGSDAARQVNRVGGWAMALSGLVYAAMWVFAPQHLAVAIGSAAIILGILVTTLYAMNLKKRYGASG